MLTAYLFDHKHGEKVEEWAGAARKLRKNQLLWVDLTDPSEEEGRQRGLLGSGPADRR